MTKKTSRFNLPLSIILIIAPLTISENLIGQNRQAGNKKEITRTIGLNRRALRRDGKGPNQDGQGPNRTNLGPKDSCPKKNS